MDGDFFSLIEKTPIRWQRWNEATWQQAAERGTPIFLSIGRVGCRWCQRTIDEVYNSSSFAELVNARYTAIGVDRDSRPDLDRVYHNAFQLLNGKTGAWPLHAVLDPDDRVPFFATSSLSLSASGALPDAITLFTRLADLYAAQPQTIQAQNRTLSDALKAGPSRHGSSGYSLGPHSLSIVIEQAKSRFDSTNGGFSIQPKAPQTALLERLSRHAWHQATRDDPDPQAELIVKFSLEKMANSPLRDVNGGFFRYAENADFSNPELEQSLAENAALAALSAQIAHFSNDETCAAISRRTADFILTELCSDEGDFFHSQTRFHDQWQRSTHRRAASNGQAIRALIIVADLLEEHQYANAAQQALAQMRERYFAANSGSIEPAVVLCLDDYAEILAAQIQMLQWRWDEQGWLFAKQLAGEMVERFNERGKQGGFYYTAETGEPLIHRPLALFDDPLPGAAGLAAQQLIRLGYWDNDISQLVIAERNLKRAWPSIEKNPLGCCGLLTALEEYYFAPQTIVLRGTDEAMQEWRSALTRFYHPRRCWLSIGANWVPSAKSLADCVAGQEPVMAYVLDGTRRSEPYTDLAAFSAALRRPPGERKQG